MITKKIREDFARAHGLLRPQQRMWARLDKEIQKTFNICGGHPREPKIAIIHSGYLEAIRFGNIMGHNIYDPSNKDLDRLFSEQSQKSNDAGQRVGMNTNIPAVYHVVRKALAVYDYNMDAFKKE